MKRETGYYFAKRNSKCSEWEIYYYEVLPHKTLWSSFFDDADEVDLKDSDFIEINETRIKKPDEK